jgi:hypothetical protein
MHILHHINMFQLLTHLLPQLSMASVVAILAGNLWFAAPMLGFAADRTNASAVAQDDDDSDDWMFDKSTYTNSSKTGKRVDQYKHEKTPYRDPNAWFDSPMGGFPFVNNGYGGFYENPFESMYYFALMPEIYGKYYFGDDGSGYYPYDGDPNDEENDDSGNPKAKPNDSGN